MNKNIQAQTVSNIIPLLAAEKEYATSRVLPQTKSVARTPRSEKPSKTHPKPDGGRSASPSDAAVGMAHLLQAIAAIPEMVVMLRTLGDEIQDLKRQIAEMGHRESFNYDAFLDSEGARDYLAKMSRGTWDKYRAAKKAIPGYQLDGKFYYKPAELERWLKLYNAA
jgi:hypothetical protein